MSVSHTSVAGDRRAATLSRPLRFVLGVAAFAALTAVSAKVAVPIPGTPVPFTFQPLVVLLAGALLGAAGGAASQALYLLAGAAGLPVFAAGGGLAYLLGPTGGYLLAYPAAAALVGGLAGGRGVRLLLALLAGLVLIYAGGVAWLAALGGFDAAVAAGLYPFLLADLVKVAVAWLLVRQVGAHRLRA